MGNAIRVLAVGVATDGLFINTSAGRLVVPESELKSMGLRKVDIVKKAIRSQRGDSGRPANGSGAARLAALDEFHHAVAESLTSHVSLYAACAKRGRSYSSIYGHIDGSPGAMALCDAVRAIVGYSKPGPKTKTAP